LHFNKIGQEYWSARELFKVLQYQKWDKFLNVIKKAKEACKNSGQIVEHHFPRVEKLVDIGSGAKRDIGDLHLSRYACYLIVQNADPSKEVIALGQTYFAIQTRKQEIIEREEFDRLKTEDEKKSREKIRQIELILKLAKKYVKPLKSLAAPCPKICQLPKVSKKLRRRIKRNLNSCPYQYCR